MSLLNDGTLKQLVGKRKLLGHVFSQAINGCLKNYDQVTLQASFLSIFKVGQTQRTSEQATEFVHFNAEQPPFCLYILINAVNNNQRWPRNT